MNHAELTQARELLARLDGKALDEAAHVYLFGVLDVDVEDDVLALWRAGFDDLDEAARRKEEVDGLIGRPERAELLRHAMLTTLANRPETASLFVDAVGQAGQAMFFAEITAVTLAAAFLVREFQQAGRSRQTSDDSSDPDRRTDPAT